MKINSKSHWNEKELIKFLQASVFPIRLSFLNQRNEPQICSLWYKFENGLIWSVSHKDSFLINQLRINPKVSFEVSSNDFPYKGVRGKAEIELSKIDAENVMKELLSRYLGTSNSQLSAWLMSRVSDECAIKINPVLVNSWDFSDRMEKKAD